MIDTNLQNKNYCRIENLLIYLKSFKVTIKLVFTLCRTQVLWLQMFKILGNEVICALPVTNNVVRIFDNLLYFRTISAFVLGIDHKLCTGV